MTTTTGRGLAVASPKLIFTESGKYCYAFSGNNIINNSNVDCLEFKTKLTPLKVLIQWGCDGVDGGNVTFTMTINGVVVMYKRVATAGSDNRDDLIVGTNQIKMILPASSDIIFNIANDASSNLDTTVWLTGETIE